jgi:hypothetical protein
MLLCIFEAYEYEQFFFHQFETVQDKTTISDFA